MTYRQCIASGVYAFTSSCTYLKDNAVELCFQQQQQKTKFFEEMKSSCLYPEFLIFPKIVQLAKCFNLENKIYSYGHECLLKLEIRGIHNV